MFKFFKKVREAIKESSTSDNKLSSTRLSAYAILVAVILIVLVGLGVEITSAIVALNGTGSYNLSNEFVIILASLLAHHLTLLGINKHNETKVKIGQKKEVEEPLD